MSFYDTHNPLAPAVNRAVQRARTPGAGDRRSGSGTGTTHGPHNPGGGNEGDGDGYSVHALIWDFDSWDHSRSVWMEDA